MDSKIMSQKEIIVSIILAQRGYDLSINRYDASIIADKIIAISESASNIKESAPSASDNTGSPELPPCDWCNVYLMAVSLGGKYKYCPMCGRQLRASA